MMDKATVNGEAADIVWEYLRGNSELMGGPVPWNFGKFLVDVGRRTVVKYYPPK